MTAPLPRARATELLGAIRGLRVVVAGDVMLDRYLVGQAERLSPEAPVPVVRVAERRNALGGAANVAANAVAAGAECALVGVVGDDPAGGAVGLALTRGGIDPAHLLTVRGRPTTCKTRVMAQGHQIVRIDDETDAPIGEGDRARLLEALTTQLNDADALLLEDYDKGALDPEFIRGAIEAARRRGVPVVVDPKFRHFFDYAGATVFKPNRRELQTALGAGADLSDDKGLPAARTRLQVANLVVTLGADGMVVVGEDAVALRIPSLAREVFDVAGAGDTVTAWLALGLASGGSIVEAAQLATVAAGIEVAKAGVATVSPNEVLEHLDELERGRTAMPAERRPGDLAPDRGLV